MRTIQSDLDGARLKATALKSATDSILQSAVPAIDTQTTVAGNKNAQEAIELARETAQQIATAVSTASTNLQSVAENFEAMDQQVGISLSQRIGWLP